MPTSQTKTVSPFLQTAIDLDAAFIELERLSGSIERTELTSDSALERAHKLLAQFGECAERIGSGIQALAKALNDSQVGTQRAAQVVTERAALIHERQLQVDALTSRYQSLVQLVTQVNDTVGQLQKTGISMANEEQKAYFLSNLPAIDVNLGVLIDEAFKVKEEAKASNLKSLEQSSDSLGQMVRSLRARLGTITERILDSSAGSMAS